MPISLNKRLKEKARQEKAQDKAVRREQRKVDKNNRDPKAEGEEDPDIAGIIPGPQPLPEGFE